MPDNVQTDFRVDLRTAKVRVIKRDPQAEAYAKRDAKSLIMSLARAYPDEFWDAVRKLQLTNAQG